MLITFHLTNVSGEVGIYIDPIDAQAVNPKEFGLEHCFMMSVRESLLDYLSRADLVKVKGALEHRGLFKGVILEGIRKGTVTWWIRFT